MSKLREDNIISEYVESGWQVIAAKFSSDIDYTHYLRGGTYVSQEASIILQNENKSDDVEKSMYSHQDWSSASETTLAQLEQKVKEPNTLLFFKEQFLK